jgi:hypothetical protein
MGNWRVVWQRFGGQLVTLGGIVLGIVLKVAAASHPTRPAWWPTQWMWLPVAVVIVGVVLVSVERRKVAAYAGPVTDQPKQSLNIGNNYGQAANVINNTINQAMPQSEISVVLLKKNVEWGPNYLTQYDVAITNGASLEQFALGVPGAAVVQLLFRGGVMSGLTYGTTKDGVSFARCNRPPANLQFDVVTSEPVDELEIVSL